MKSLEKVLARRDRLRKLSEYLLRVHGAKGVVTYRTNTQRVFGWFKRCLGTPITYADKAYIRSYLESRGCNEVTVHGWRFFKNINMHCPDYDRILQREVNRRKALKKRKKLCR